MATLEEMNQFRIRRGKIRSHTPIYGVLPAGTIQDYSPDKTQDTRLGMHFMQRDVGNTYSWYGKYNFFGQDWDPQAEAMLSDFEFEYDLTRKCLYPVNLDYPVGSGTVNTGRGDYIIKEFIIVRVLSGNLVTSIEWVSPTNDTDLYRTAYTWPEC